MFGFIGNICTFVKDVVVSVVTTTITFVIDIFKNLPAIVMMGLATIGMISLIPALEFEASIAGITMINKYMVIPVISTIVIYLLGILSGVWYELFST